ncbi:MAG: hypothetical protein SW833_02780 [Cyanobacteriota bacterium]|nr:hypothetical protein [Cyanobacteriota bacterium]
MKNPLKRETVADKMKASNLQKFTHSLEWSTSLWAQDCRSWVDGRLLPAVYLTPSQSGRYPIQLKKCDRFSFTEKRTSTSGFLQRPTGILSSADL